MSFFKHYCNIFFGLVEKYGLLNTRNPTRNPKSETRPDPNPMLNFRYYPTRNPNSETRPDPKPEKSLPDQPLLKSCRPNVKSSS